LTTDEGEQRHPHRRDPEEDLGGIAAPPRRQQTAHEEERSDRERHHNADEADREQPLRDGVEDIPCQAASLAAAAGRLAQEPGAR
jgi:hypothetical protein